MSLRKEIKDAAKFMIPAFVGAGLTAVFGPVPVIIGLGGLAFYARRSGTHV